MKWLFVLLFLFCYSSGFSQDTLFSVRYPDGIVSRTHYMKRKRYHLYPVNKPGRRIIFLEKTLIKIHYSNGQVFENKNYYPKNYFYLNTNQYTGDIEYKKTLALPDKNIDLSEEVASALSSKTLEVKTLYLSEDSAIYQLRFDVIYANKKHLAYFKLNLLKSNNKLTICANDLKSCKIDTLKYNWSFMNSIIGKSEGVVYPTQMYSKARRFSYQKKYWDVIKENLENTLWEAQKQYYPESKRIDKSFTKDSLIFRKFNFIEGLTGYGNYSDKYEKNPESINKDLMSIGLRYGTQWNFRNNENYRFGLGLNMGTLEMFIGDRGVALSISAGEIGPCITRTINNKSNFEIDANVGASVYFRMESDFIGYTPTKAYWNIKNNIEFKYRYQKFVIGMQGSYRYPQGMFGTSLLIGYCFN